MYGLEGLREVITCTLKIEKCHLFHKVIWSIILESGKFTYNNPSHIPAILNKCWDWPLGKTTRRSEK